MVFVELVNTLSIKKISIGNQEKRSLFLFLINIEKKNGDYDVLIPGSGGKDTIYLSHVLKYKYKMNPLTITWAPHLYTEIGWHNFFGKKWDLIMNYTPLIQKFTEN